MLIVGDMKKLLGIVVLGLVFYIKKKGEISRPSKAFKKI